MEINHTELAWAAGFYDGEGSASSSSDYLKLPALSLNQVDIRPLRRFHAAVLGLGTVRGPYERGNQPIYEWSAKSFIHAQAVIGLLWKYWSEPKREQAHRVMTAFYQRTLRRGPRGKDGKIAFCKVGHSLADAYTFPSSNGRIYRRCKPCAKTNGSAYYANNKAKIQVRRNKRAPLVET